MQTILLMVLYAFTAVNAAFACTRTETLSEAKNLYVTLVLRCR